MSEWGLVGFSYDYERLGSNGEKKRVRGVISKAYKNTGISGMVKHAFNGFRYFMRRYNNKYYRYDMEYVTWNYWKELNASFDVFFEQEEVEFGVDCVSGTLDKWAPEKEIECSSEDLDRYLFTCEGFYGYILINFTGNPVDGYETKYGYYLNGKVLGMKGAMEEYYSYIEKNSGKDDGYYEHILENKESDMAMASFFDENATLIQNEDEFWHLKDLGVEIVREKIDSDRIEFAKKSGILEDEDSIGYLDVSVRTLNSLMRYGVKTVGELKAMTSEELRSVRNLGEKGFIEITQKLQELEQLRDKDSGVF